MTFDDLPQEGSSNPVKSGGVWSELQRKSNPNLLDNWYFVNPVNQRGQTEYTGPCYTIDRWYINGYGLDKKLSLVEGGIHVTGEEGIDPPWSMTVSQRMEKEKVVNGLYTVSLLEADGRLYSYQLDFRGGTTDNKGKRYRVALNAKENYIAFEFYPQPTVIGGTTISAAKLEFGDHQTLAHQDAEGNWVLNDPPPDYQQELAKCQRYMLSLNALDTQNYFGAFMINNGSIIGLCPTPVTMRAKGKIVAKDLNKLKWWNPGGIVAGKVTMLEVYGFGNSGLVLRGVASNINENGFAGYLYAEAGNPADVIVDANL